MPPAGIHAVTVPGAVDGWAQLHKRFGNLPWDRLFASAIAYADQGFPVTEVIQEQWTAPISFERLLSHAESSRVFLPGGKPLGPGGWLIQSDLAKSISSIAEHGASAFYQGDIARLTARYHERNGGLLRYEDLTKF